MLEMLFMTAFAAVSSSGVSTRDGRRAAAAGWNADEAIVAATARTNTMSQLAPVNASTAIPVSRTTRTTSAASIVRRRDVRSASTANQGAATAPIPQRTA